MAKESKGNLASLSVIFLEDEPLVAMDTTECLEAMGIGRVTTVYNLRSARSACESEDFDLALLDINVGRGQTSYEFGSSLRNSGTTVIFASGTETERHRLVEDGYLFLSKPYNQADLLAQLEKALQERHSRHVGAGSGTRLSRSNSSRP
jgi:DNA-binding response OmpR family regulator